MKKILTTIILITGAIILLVNDSDAKGMRLAPPDDVYPSIITDQTGYFYARVPKDKKRIEIYRVRKDADEIVNTYKFEFGRKDFILCGNYKTNEVGLVMGGSSQGGSLNIFGDNAKEVLKFYFDGTLQEVITIGDFIEMGAQGMKFDEGRMAIFYSIRCETWNKKISEDTVQPHPESVLLVEFKNKKTMTLDFRTGKKKIITDLKP